jgi:nitrous oxidase accessory protein
MIALLAALAVTAACPPGADVARDGETLDRMLADGGPEDIWVAGLVRGEHLARRGVRLHGCDRAVLRGDGKGTLLKIEGDGALVEDLVFEGSGSRVSFEDGALKVSGKGVVVRRVTVRDCLYGIAMEKCPDCLLEDSSITGRLELEDNLRGDGIKLWEAHGSTVRRNRVDAVRDVVVWYSRHVTLEDNVITRGRYGTHFMYAHDSTVRRSRLLRNVVGIFVMYSARMLLEDNVLAGAHGSAGMGLGFKESDGATVRGNRLVANTAGTYLDQTPRDASKTVLFEDNLFALDGVAVRTHSSERGAIFRSNDFVDDDALVEVDGNGDARGVSFVDNHWSAYAGYDLDHDGTGDVPFQLKVPSSDLNDAHPTLKWFRGTAAMGLYDAIAQALPFFGARLLLEDARPAWRLHREVPR